jgi:soluble lytic murein transglycosylase-like protein/TolA-binding protein
LIASALLLAALVTAPLPGGDRYVAARAAENDAKFAEAYPIYKECADAGGPLAPYAMVRGARCMALGGSQNEAIEVYRTTVQNFPEGPWIRLAEIEFAELLVKMGRYQDASRLYSHALDLNVRPTWMRRYEWGAADALLKDSETQNSGYRYFRSTMESARYGSERLDAARRLIVSPDFDDRVAALSGMLQSVAVKDARDALGIVQSNFAAQSASSADLKLLQFGIDALTGDPAAALTQVTLLLEQSPEQRFGPLALHLIARGFIGKEQYEATRSVCDTMAKLFPKAPLTGESFWRLGAALAEAKHHVQAIDVYTRLAEACPEHPRAGDAVLAAGRLCEGDGNTETAIATYRKLAASPTPNRRTAAALFRSGELAEKLGRRDEALNDYLRSIQEPIGDFYVHRAADRVHTLDSKEQRIGPSLPVTGEKSFVRSIAIGQAAPQPEDVLNEERMQRLQFFGAHGLPEGEWEALDIAQSLDGGPKTAAYLRAMGDAGLAHTAMETADALNWGLQNGAPTAERLCVLFPRAYWDAAAAEAKLASVDPYLLLAIARQESTFRAAIESHAGAKGVMQVMPSTAKWITKSLETLDAEDAQKLHDPSTSIRLGARYIGMMLERYNGNVVLALGAYNAGPGNMNKWIRAHETDDMDAFIQNIPYEETKNYVRRVLGNYAAYRSLYPSDVGK